MSEYTVCECDCKDKEVLLDTIKEMGFHAEEGSNLHLYGYEGDKREQTADLVIRRKNISSASNDIGFVKRPDGKYDLVISEFDRSNRVGRRFVEDFPKLYATNVTVKELKKKGYKLKKKIIEENGTIELRFT